LSGCAAATTCAKQARRSATVGVELDDVSTCSVEMHSRPGLHGELEACWRGPIDQSGIDAETPLAIAATYD
jgi:hypothetical protein